MNKKFLRPLLFAIIALSVAMNSNFTSAQVVESDTGLDQLLEETTGPDSAVKTFERNNPEIRTAAEQFSKRDFVGASETLKEAREKNPGLPPVGVVLGTWHAGEQPAGGSGCV